MKALVFGEILWDIIEGVPHLGGAPLNYAAHLTQCGNHATIVSAVGNDELGERALDLVAKMGVDTSLVQQVEKPTGYVPVTLKNGQPDYEITRNVAYDYIDWGVLSEHNLKEFDVFYFGSIIQRNSMSAESLYNLLDRFEFANVFYDVNFLASANYRRQEGSEQLDVSAGFSYQALYALEVTYRGMPGRSPNDKIINSSSVAFIASMFNIPMGPGVMHLGYSYDYNLTGTGLRDSSHELSIRFNFSTNNWQHKRQNRSDLINMSCPLSNSIKRRTGWFNNKAKKKGKKGK